MDKIYVKIPLFDQKVKFNFSIILNYQKTKPMMMKKSNSLFLVELVKTSQGHFPCFQITIINL